MKSVCVLGNGQLGRMLRQAGEPLGISVFPIGIDANPDELPIKQSIITAEVERWPETALTRQLATHDAFINRDIFPRLADRLPQKQLLDQLGLATAPWRLLQSVEQWPALFSELGELLIVKRRTGGYDGKGQWRLTAASTAELPDEGYGECIVEQAIAFKGELSLIGARNAAGEIVFYPVTYNLHQQGILYASVVHPQPLKAHQQQAEAMLTAILTELDYVGVMAMECFVTDDGLLINELAPRVHNSGHWTQNGASISQFALHLRAICNLALPQPVVEAPSVMVNLIGTELDYRWLADARIQLHWYDKQVRAGRKVGHLNLNSSDSAALTESLGQLTAILPADYTAALKWAISHL